MSRFGRIHRQPDHFSSAHERARARAAERVDGPLGLAEATWLEEHLAGCPACAAIAAEYEADRQALRAMRENPPEPPRDLWARTAAAIEQESAARGRSGAPMRSSRRRVPLGAMSGLAVVAIVVAVTAVSGDFLNGGSGGSAASSPAADAASTAPEIMSGGGAAQAEAEATPIAVGAGNVKWLRVDGDGQLAFNDASVNEVCPIDGAADCGTIDDPGARGVALAGRPKTIIKSPVDDQVVVLSGGDQVVVTRLADHVEAAAASPDASVDTEQTASPSADVDPSPSDVVEPSDGSATPSDDASTAATDDPTASAAASAAPTEVPTASPSPEPTIAASLAIASGVEVVGESAAFSADGAWFAFSARPADGSGGPDIYVWKVGDQEARQLTDDGQSTFASWAGDAIIASRPDAGDTSAAEIGATTVTIDPATGAEAAAATSWRPAVDPSGTRAVAWAGTIVAGPDGDGWRPSEGRLELQSWPDGGADSQVVVDGDVSDFDVRWDETGEWFAVWVADDADPAIGRLSLFTIAPDTGELKQPDGAPDGTPALAGYSIGEGRLAWATPPGQGGEGSRVRIAAWTEDGVGAAESAPGAEVIVIR
jgi:hypothetical protein